MATFFSFDGIDGVGKSTQLRLFCEWLAERKIQAVVCRDPGSTPLGEEIRKLLLGSGDEISISPTAEMLLYMAARAQLVEQIIRPALAAGGAVVCDRFLLANIVYQGYAGGVDLELIRQVGDVATSRVAPHCTYLLDMEPERALARVGRPLDRMESRGAEYRRKLRAGFLAEASLMGSTVHVVDADRDVAEVQREIRQIAASVLGPA